MGIKLGNTFIKKHCKKDIHNIYFEMLKNMTLVVDTSIYMYRFLEDDRLEDNFNLLINIFKTNNITPVFVFDGAAKENKRATLRERERCRRYAEYEYKETQEKLTNAKSSLEKLYIATELAAIKRRTVRVTVEHKELVKKIITVAGYNYIDAPHESDEVCAKLVLSKVAHGVMTEDMDMFVYGCQHVYRCLDIANGTIIKYNLKGIIKTLDMTLTEFKELFVISGTDYNKSKENIFYYYDMFKKYKADNSAIKKHNNKWKSFYDWLEYNTDCIDNYSELLEVYFMFDLNNRDHDYLKQYEKHITIKIDFK